MFFIKFFFIGTIGIFWILFFFVMIVGDRFWVNIIVLLCRELILGKWIVLSLICLISEVVKFIFFLSFFVLFLFLKRILIYCKMFNLEFVKWEYKNVVWRFIMIILLLFVVCRRIFNIVDLFIFKVNLLI